MAVDATSVPKLLQPTPPAPTSATEAKPIIYGNTPAPGLHSFRLKYSAFTSGKLKEVGKLRPEIEELCGTRLRIDPPLERLRVIQDQSDGRKLYFGITMCLKCLAPKEASAGKTITLPISTWKLTTKRGIAFYL
jgi:hypothetical protein